MDPPFKGAPNDGLVSGESASGNDVDKVVNFSKSQNIKMDHNEMANDPRVFGELVKALNGEGNDLNEDEEKNPGLEPQSTSSTANGQEPSKGADDVNNDSDNDNGRDKDTDTD
jgi:hypothetical protein